MKAFEPVIAKRLISEEDAVGGIARLYKYLAAVAIIVVCSLAYAQTLAPGVTWANDGFDSGDLITAVVTRGVAHPTGYPAYLLLAQLFAFLPFSDLAFKVTLLSAVAAVLAVLVMYALVVAGLDGDEWRTVAAGGIAALSLGFAPIFWSQAVIAEVYSLNALFAALLLWFVFRVWRGPSPGSKWRNRLGALVAGLALGNHVTILPLVCIWLGVSSRAASVSAWLFRLLRRMGWLCVGLLVYLYLPLSAAGNPPVNWGRPLDWRGFWWMVTGQLYTNLAFGVPADLVLQRLAAWAHLLVQQFGWLGVTLGCFGLLYGGKAVRPLVWLTCGLALFYSGFAIGYNTAGSYAYLIPVYQIFAFWIGLGIGAALEGIASFRVAYAGVAVVAIGAVLLWPALYTAQQVDASHDRRAIGYATTILNQAPAAAIIVTSGDRETFPLWYYHYASGQRPDLALVTAPLLDFAWYRANLRAIYPDLRIPDEAPQGWLVTLAERNQERGPICRATVDPAPGLQCE
jgi:hypothetical protein